MTPSQLSGDLLFNLLAAEFAGNAGDIEDSVSFYNRAAEETSDSRIAARAAYIALYGQDYKEALAATERWQTLEPQSQEVDKMFAVIYLKLHQPEKAVSYIRKIFAGADTTPANKVLALKEMLTKEASTEDALAVLQIMNAQDKKDKTLNNHMLVLQARFEAQLKNYDEALALLEQAYENDNAMIDVLIIKARILTAQGKDEEAAAQIRQALAQRPENNALRLQYARMLIEQHKLEEAKEHYLVLSENLPENDDVKLALALIYIDTRELDKATEELEALIEMDKKTSVANYYLGRIAQNQGEDKQAIAYYLRVKDESYQFDSQLRIAALLAALGRADEGLDKLEALAQEQSSWSRRVRVYLAQGEILRAEGRYRDGVEMYSRALLQKPDDPNLLYARGLMAEKIDRLDMAESDLRKVIALEPQNANALNALGYTLADRTERYQEALKYILRASELVPDDPAILDSLGWVSFRLGKMEEAEKWLSKAFEKLTDAEIAAHYGEVLWAINKKDKAREVWQKGKEQDAEHPVLLETLERIKP